MSIKNIKPNEIILNIPNPSSKTELNLSNSNITNLPSDLSKFTNLYSLDLSNNPLKNYTKIAESLSTLPKLKDLHINLPSIENVKIILSHLPYLQILNNKPLDENMKFNLHNNKENININLIEDLDLNENEIKEDLESEIINFNNILNGISYLENDNENNENNVNVEFKLLLENKMKILNDFINKNIPNFFYLCKLIKIKIEIYKFFQDKILIILNNNLLNNNNNFNNEKINNSLLILNDLNNIINEKNENLLNIINLINDKIIENDLKIKKYNNNLMNENYKLNELITEKKRENFLLEETNKKLNEENDVMKIENNIISQRFVNENLLKIDDLDNTLKNYKKFINKNKKSPTKNNNNKTNLKNKNYNPNINKNNNNNNKNNNKNNTKNNNNPLIISSSSTINNLDEINNNNSIIQNSPTFILTLEQMLSLINDIYKQKLIYNKKCIESEKPLETLYNFIIIYLNQKFGLKEITINYFSSLIKGIKDYSKFNSEILLFGLLLRNEIEENSINILNQIKNILNETLKFFVIEKNQNKNLDEINEIINNYKKGFLNEEIWLKIIECFFIKDKKSLEYFKQKVYNFIEKIIEKGFKNNKKNPDFEMDRDEKNLFYDIKKYKKISYNDLFNLLLNYHIRTREKYLTNFKKIFNENDKNKDGILNKNEFINLFKDLKIFDDKNFNYNIDLLLKKMPINEKFNQFNFSEIVDVLDNEKINECNNQSISDIISNQKY